MSFPTGPTVGVFAPNTNSANTPPPNADNLSGAGARRNKTQSQFLNTIATLAELAASQRKEIVEARAAYDKAMNFSSNLMSECVAATNRAVAAELECSRLLESLASVRRENDNLEAAKLDLQTRLQKEMSQTKALRRTIASKNKQSPERSPRQPTTSPENAQTPKSATHTLVSTPPTSRPELQTGTPPSTATTSRPVLQPGTPPARAARRHSVTLLGHPEDRIGGGPLDILIATKSQMWLLKCTITSCHRALMYSAPPAHVFPATPSPLLRSRRANLLAPWNIETIDQRLLALNPSTRPSLPQPCTL